MITREKLIEYIDKGLSQRTIAEFEQCSQTSIRHWMKKFNIKSKYGKTDNVVDGQAAKLCRKCDIIKKRSDFYFRTGKEGISGWCKECNRKSTLARQFKFKIDCLEYKGNTGCIVCQYNRYSGALEFHHRDSIDKEFEISKFKLYKFNENVAKELDKCDVLCSNCHKEEHRRLTDLRNGTVTQQ